MTNKETIYKQSEEYYRKGNVVIAREYGKHENGNMFGGCWVARAISTGEYIDNDRNRMDLFERLGFKDEEFSGYHDPIRASLILMLTTELPTPGKRYWVRISDGFLVIENRRGGVYFEESGNKEYLDYLEVVYRQPNSHNGERCLNPQKFHPADIAEAIECFIGRAMSLQPTKEYSSKAADTLPRILAREKILKATRLPGKIQGKVAFEDVIGPRIKIQIYMGEVSDKANLKAKLTGLLEAAMAANNPHFGHMWKDAVLGLFEENHWFECILNQPYRNKSILVIEAGRVPEGGKVDDMQLSWSFIPAVGDHDGDQRL